MEIKYLGGKSLYIKSKKEALLVDPAKADWDNSKLASRLLVFTTDGFEYWEPEKENKVVVRGPGEYEVGGIEVLGYKGGGEGNTIYTALVDGVMVGILGELKEPLTDKKIERIAGVDVLVVSIGKDNKVGYKDIVDLAKKWGVNYLVPINYSEEELKKFLDETDNEMLESVENLKADKDNLPDGLEVVVLKDGRSG